ncbi:MAG: S24/S26 family peptidase [Dehalococcoidia bacterium]|nr:S24/S26 family peptidase [Dehalococcoidia bacterium]
MSDRASRPRSLRARLASGAATGAILALWFGLAPTSIGGDYSYVIVHGNSMEPHLHGGDIVLLRRERVYGIGEVVAYRDPMLGPVLHRIDARHGDRFVLRGDNRERVDAYTPLPEDVLGREAAVWPRGLSVILALTSMRSLLTLAGAVVALGVASQLRARSGLPRYRRTSTGLAALRARR